MIKQFISFLFWKYVGEFSILGKFNGKFIAISIANESVSNYVIQSGGRLENFKYAKYSFSKGEIDEFVRIVKEEEHLSK